MEKKKIIKLISIAATSLMLIPAHADKFYVRMDAAFPVYSYTTGAHSQNKIGFRVFSDAAIGAKLSNNISVELEGVYLNLPSTNPNSSAMKMDYRAIAGFVNSIYRFSGFNNTQFFIGQGLGYGNSSTSDTIGGPIKLQNGQSNSDFAYQIFIGANYAINPAWGVTLALKWMHFNNFSSLEALTSEKVIGNLKTLAITSGLHFNF